MSYLKNQVSGKKRKNGHINIELTINKIKELFSPIDHNHNDVYYTQEQIDNLTVITPDEIDEICGTTIEMASEVTF